MVKPATIRLRGDGNVTTIVRDTSGAAIAIRAPGGQETTFELDANGYLSTISNPVAVPTPETYTFTYTDDGLMTTMKDPKQNEYVFTYDETGRLIRDEDPAGGVQTLAREDDGANYVVTHETLLGRATSYEVENLANGDTRQSVVAPSGLRRPSTAAATVARRRPIPMAPSP